MVDSTHLFLDGRVFAISGSMFLRVRRLSIDRRFLGTIAFMSGSIISAKMSLGLAPFLTVDQNLLIPRTMTLYDLKESLPQTSPDELNELLRAISSPTDKKHQKAYEEPYVYKKIVDRMYQSVAKVTSHLTELKE
ncbi:hypothetical protein MAR_020345 [Mya arenaria]|uniref:Uncharacterized protein n=1 Tax=Mya arenaria TaxID=6604 RepID=A0ABY7ECU8_MYAAR|nr:hypothetical protein MAR_020345 [Mya arenaria]